MKILVLLTCLLVITLANSSHVDHPRGCIYIRGRCSRECPVGTHSYKIGCDYLTPEASCANPNPEKGTRENSVKMCDVSKCYCDPPTVRDSVSGNCIALEDCPKNT